MENETIRVPANRLHQYCREIFKKLGEPDESARIIADVLLAADLRGIDSHGVARMGMYVKYMRAGMIRPNMSPEVVCETPATALIDAKAGMGQPVGYQAMQMTIAKAKTCGVGWVTVRNSNHYGIAGYYAMMALEHDCIGISMTNSAVFVVPTFGRDAMLGTNPIAVAAPSGSERPFVLDMATSTVPFGKLEVYDRLEKPIPPGWATDENGLTATDSSHVMDNMHQQPLRGGLTPLGGEGELFGGHKGYGLGMLVDVLCGVLPGALYANLVYPQTAGGESLPPGLGHLFAAVRVDAFRPVEEFKASMDDLQRRMKAAPKADGQERIYIHGEKEYEQAERRQRDGIPVNHKVYAELKQIGVDCGVQVLDDVEI
jgi:LDH2 family malate/lactate/ureidoglycolate dehydrogenase